MVKETDITYIHIYIHTYLHTCIHTHIQTHTHTCTYIHTSSSHPGCMCFRSQAGGEASSSAARWGTWCCCSCDAGAWSTGSRTSLWPACPRAQDARSPAQPRVSHSSLHAHQAPFFFVCIRPSASRSVVDTFTHDYIGILAQIQELTRWCGQYLQSGKQAGSCERERKKLIRASRGFVVLQSGWQLVSLREWER